MSGGGLQSWLEGNLRETKITTMLNQSHESIKSTKTLMHKIAFHRRDMHGCVS